MTHYRRIRVRSMTVPQQRTWRDTCELLQELGDTPKTLSEIMTGVLQHGLGRDTMFERAHYAPAEVVAVLETAIAAGLAAQED